LWLLFRFFYWSHFSFPDSITIPEGWGYLTIKQELWWLDGVRFAMKVKKQIDTLPVIVPGTYDFTKVHTRDELIDTLNQWPTIEYKTVTLLEWWSSYDTDQWLARKHTQPWEYRAFITNQDIIQRYKERYPFLREEFLWTNITTLEWFLYPDTYKLDAKKNLIDQLVYLQLENRKQKLRDPFESQWLNLQKNLRNQGYSFKISPYQAIVLASIVDKEEPKAANKAIVTSVFFNRLDNNMRIDADISLCYGLWQPYSACSPQVIVRNLKDNTNRWNTRARQWLPPTPISNPEITSIQWFFEAKPTEYFFYLHDNSGRLHTAKTLTEHNQNVAQYLR
jgi:UPF0755 protein